MPASELIGILAAVVILLIAFGSLLAMGLPIMTALFGIGIGLAVVNLLARVLDVPSFAPQVTAMIGIGVGIDYALFISTRYREALHDGADPEARGRARDRHERPGRALRRRHGRDLAARPVPHRRVVHPRARGRRVARGAVRDGRRGHAAARGARVRRATRSTSSRCRARARSATHEQSFWVRWSRTLQARPWPVAIGSLLILLVLAVPFVSLRLGVADAGNDPTKFTTRALVRPAQRGFRARLQRPAAAREQRRQSPTTSPRWTRSGEAIADDPDVQQVEPGDPEPERQGRAAPGRAEGLAAGREHDRSSCTASATRPCPTATEGSTLDVHVGGQTAIGVDLADTLGTPPALRCSSRSCSSASCC